MTSIQHVNSCPEYIDAFIRSNKEQLLTIYEAGYENNQHEGCLGLYCNEETNKMDVMFFNEENLQLMITKESWTDLKYSRGEKKLLICQDCDLNSIFLIFL